eukprot:3054581-Pyramimonas_sp.AAC.1
MHPCIPAHNTPRHPHGFRAATRIHNRRPACSLLGEPGVHATVPPDYLLTTVSRPPLSNGLTVLGPPGTRPQNGE